MGPKGPPAGGSCVWRQYVIAGSHSWRNVGRIPVSVRGVSLLEAFMTVFMTVWPRKDRAIERSAARDRRPKPPPRERDDRAQQERTPPPGTPATRLARIGTGGTKDPGTARALGRGATEQVVLRSACDHYGRDKSCA
jgi:hypothetical protein